MIEGFVESQGVKIHYFTNDVRKTEQVSLLFVPGVMMPAWIWEKQLEYFSKKYRVVAMDPRSHGDSELCTEGHDAFSMSKDIKAVVDALHLQPLVLIGWSIGVPQAVNYAAHFGSKELIGLVLVDGLLGIDPRVPFYQATIDLWNQLQVDRVLKTPEFIREIFQQPQPEAYFGKLNEAALRMPTNTVMTLIHHYIAQDFRPLLPSITVPTWIATIEGPRLDYMKKMESMLPKARLDIFPSAGHALFVDQPERFNHLLETFIEHL